MLLSSNPTNTIDTKHNRQHMVISIIFYSNWQIENESNLTEYSHHSAIQTFQDEITKSHIQIAENNSKIVTIFHI